MKIKEPNSRNPADNAIRRNIERQKSLFEKEGIPWYPEGVAPLNNHLARTSLFAPIGRGRRKYHKGTVLASQGDATIKVYGEQFDMADQNVLLHAYNLAAAAKAAPTDGDEVPSEQSRVVVNRAQFLEAINMKRSGQNYHWLHNSFIRLASCIIEIETKHYSTSYQLIGPPHLDKDTGIYSFHIPKTAFAFFANSGFGYVNMARRLALTVRVDLGSWIQGIAVSHDRSQEHTFTLELLRQRCGQVRAMRKFRVAFKEALEDLKRQGEFEYAYVTDDDKFVFKVVEDVPKSDITSHP